MKNHREPLKISVKTYTTLGVHPNAPLFSLYPTERPFYTFIRTSACALHHIHKRYSALGVYMLLAVQIAGNCSPWKASKALRGGGDGWEENEMTEVRVGNICTKNWEEFF